MPVTTWAHDDPFVPGTTVRSDAANFKFNGIAACFEQIAYRLNNKTIELPDTFSGQTKIPNKTVANTLLFINSAGNMDLFSKTQFDQDVANTATLAAQVATQAGQVGSDRLAVASDRSSVAADKLTVSGDKTVVAADKVVVAGHRAYVESVMPQVSAAANAAVSVEADRQEVANNTATVQSLSAQVQSNATTSGTNAANAYNYMLLAQAAAGAATGGMYFAGEFNAAAGWPPTPAAEDGTPVYCTTTDNLALQLKAGDFAFYDQLNTEWRTAPGTARVMQLEFESAENEIFALAGL